MTPSYREQLFAAFAQAASSSGTWRSLEVISPWRLGDENRIDTSYSPSSQDLDDAWERSRQLVAGPVFDARIDTVDRVQYVVRGDRARGIPDVETVTVWIDLIGQFDGEYRGFVNVNVIRGWPLQRVNGGPWQISTVQQL